MLNLPHSQAVLSIVPTRRDKFPPGPAVPDHIIIIMAPLFPLDIGPYSLSPEIGDSEYVNSYGGGGGSSCV